MTNADESGAVEPLTAFVLSFERPIYLWATLDSLYRATKSSVRYILIDHGSRDPTVHTVIDGFVRRGLLDHVYRLPENSIEQSNEVFYEWIDRLGDVFLSVENDVVIRERKDCWAESMAAVMRRDPHLAMLGSRVDKRDFIKVGALEARLGRSLTVLERQTIKADSPERTMPNMGPEDIASPFNPPGRLLALRTEAVRQHGLAADYLMHARFMAHGWRTAIYGGVVHRHLSLCNYFDWPDYSMAQRDEFIGKAVMEPIDSVDEPACDK